MDFAVGTGCSKLCVPDAEPTAGTLSNAILFLWSVTEKMGIIHNHVRVLQAFTLALTAGLYSRSLQAILLIISSGSTGKSSLIDVINALVAAQV
mgnify:FL=1